MYNNKYYEEGYPTLLSKNEMLKLGREIQRKNKELSELVNSSPYLRKGVLERMKKIKEKYEDKFETKTQYFILGIGEVQLYDLLKEYEAGAKNLCKKIHETYQALKKAKNKLVMANIGLLKKTANSLNKTPTKEINNFTFDDRVQSGIEEMIESTQVYNPKRNAKYHTWAKFRVYEKIKRDMMNNGRVIRLPIGDIHVLSTLRKARDYLKINNVEISYENLSKLTTYSQKQIRYILQRKFQTSVVRISKDDEKQFAISDEKNFLDDVIKKDFQQAVRKILSKTKALTPKERDVLKKMNGIGHDECHTLEQVGKQYGLTKERIRQIQNEALRKLKRDTKTMERLGRVWNAN